MALLALLALVACGSPEPAIGSSAPAIASEPAMDPAVRAACEGGLGSIRVVAPLPSGVREDTGDRQAVIAAAAGWHMPEGVTFAVDGTPRVAGEVLTIRGELVNATDAPQDVFLSEAGVGYFHATLTGPSLTRRPLPPAPPRARRLRRSSPSPTASRSRRARGGRWRPRSRSRAGSSPARAASRCTGG
jgi:hypothetical protein